MPEQQSKRGDVVTASQFTGAFENHLVRFGAKGLNLKDALDALEGWARHTNLDHDDGGEAIVRAGQTALATAGVLHHSVRKLRDEQAGTFTRIWGIDTSLYLGMSGALSAIDAGYSGDPLTLLPHRPPLSGDPWMFVADRQRMRKVRADGLDLPIGLPAPVAAATATLGTEYRTTIADFGAVDGTEAANWVGAPGVDENGNPSGIPSAVNDTSSPPGGGVYFTTNDGNIDSPYDTWWGVALTRDLSLLTEVGGAATRPASDDDILHLWMKTSHPQLIQEVRIYLVVSAGFDPLVLPGTPNPAFANTDAYVKGFRQNDFVQFVQATQTQIDAAETARVFATRDRDLRDRRINDDRDSWASTRAVADPARGMSVQIGTGGQQWFELGSIGLSLRRGDFQRIGNSPGRDWSTVTGLIVYVRLAITDTDREVALAVDDLYLTGGFGPDTVEPGAQQYDWRYTHYDPRTGAEGNGSPEMAETSRLDAISRQCLVTPAAYGDGTVRQRFYRRGGSLVDDWYFEGQNSADGGVFTDTETDDGLSAAGTLPIDHYQPVPTVDDAGTTILAQPCQALWGPLEGMLFACGDPYRPGHLYYCLPDTPDHWSANGNTEVCPPSEVLMNGGLVGAQAFVFSKERLYAIYPNLTGVAGSVTTAPTLCKRGLRLSRWGMVVGPGGIYFVAEDGIFLTSGGPEEWISRELDPLFTGVPKHGLQPIDKTAASALRLTVWENKLYFSYQDVLGQRQVLVYAILYKTWRHYTFGRAQTLLQGEDEDLLLIGSLNLGTTYTHEGLSDAGLAIAWRARTGAISGGSREEKLFGDQFLDCDRAGGSITVQNFLNEETVSNLTQTITTETGRQRYILDAFGEGPQKAHSISLEVRGSTSEGRVVLYQTGVAITMQPDITNRRVTNWDDLGASDEVWLSGVTFDCDTGDVEKTVRIERDYNGVRDTVATLVVRANGRHKLSFSWPSLPARMVRVHPDSEVCEFWLLYRADWIWQPEPPRISQWDVHFENAWDQYHTGLDLYCDTGGLEKRVEVFVDGVQLTNDLAGGLTYWPVVASGRQVVHLTIPWGRGHVYRFRAIDANPGLLYQHRWQLQAEPSEQANFNENFSVTGTLADKWFKAFLFEVDTFGQVKNVTVELDGLVVETLTVQTTGRQVVQLALTRQRLGRVLRVFPTDGNPARSYTITPIFDQEPYQLDRWETQETNHGLPGWFYLLYAHVVLKSTLPVTLTIDMQINQRGTVVTETYVIPATSGKKQRRFVTFNAIKGVLVKYTLASDVAFWLYRDELTVVVQGWGAAESTVVRPFGNDNADSSRSMVSSVRAAQVTGGSAT